MKIERRTFVTSDLHFHHKSIIKHCSRPFADLEEMHEALIRNWNAKICLADRVYVIGDFSFTSNKKKMAEVMEQLNGEKFLVIGNHDDLKVCQEFFEWTRDLYDYVHKEGDPRFIGRKAVFCHYPMYSWNESHNGAILCHGHEHNRQDDFIKHYQELMYGVAFNIGIDVNDYAPVDIEDIFQKHDEIGNKHISSNRNSR